MDYTNKLKTKVTTFKVGKETMKEFSRKLIEDESTKSKKINQLIEEFLKAPYSIERKEVEEEEMIQGVYLKVENWVALNNYIGEETINGNRTNKTSVLKEVIEKYTKK